MKDYNKIRQLEYNFLKEQINRYNMTSKEFNLDSFFLGALLGFMVYVIVTALCLIYFKV